MLSPLLGTLTPSLRRQTWLGLTSAKIVWSFSTGTTHSSLTSAETQLAAAAAPTLLPFLRWKLMLPQAAECGFKAGSRAISVTASHYRLAARRVATLVPRTR